MKQYIGTKVINALPMTRLAYNEFRGWVLPADENGDDEGYLVEYVDGGKANTEQYAGYVSWSPKDVFERAYKERKMHTIGYVCGVTCHPGGPTCNNYCRDSKIPSPGIKQVPLLNFGEAVEALKSGARVSRSGWNGKGMWLSFVHSDSYGVSTDVMGGCKPLPWIGMRTADAGFVPWLASQTDILAEDWEVI